ncbi:MAG: tetraacyldisaccharide 4'-kinase [Gammaproteobacteria bacterium]
MSRNKFAAIERRIERLWYGQSRVAVLALPLAWLYRSLVFLRRIAYRTGLLKSRRCGVPVVVVGNITVGGTGKTPLVAWIADRMAAEGRKVGILSRGYGGIASGGPLIVTRDSPVSDVGDEALLLARQTAAIVCVGADRVAGARRLARDAAVDLIVCDDGLQHYRLDRDLEIAVVDGDRGLGNGWLLPAGPLREPARRLEEVDLVFVNGGSGERREHRFDLRPRPARSLIGAKERELEEFRGQRVWAVAGIGNPERFAAMLRAAGMKPLVPEVADHGTLSLEALRDERAWPILMTSKDAVKYPATSIGDAWCVPVEIDMPAPDESALMNSLRELYV